MVAVLAADRRRQPRNESCSGLAEHPLETVCRHVMTLVDDHVTVVRDGIVNNAFPGQTLNDANIDEPGACGSPAADSTDRLWRDAEED